LSEVFPLPPVPQVSRQGFILPYSFALTESLRFLLSCPPVGRRSTSSDPRPLQRHPPSEPHSETGRSTPASDPLAGFRNPSAVSWQTWLSRPYFVPQPFLGSPFRAFPSQRLRTPLGATVLPCSYRPACRDAPLSPYCHRFRRLPRLHAVA